MCDSDKQKASKYEYGNTIMSMRTQMREWERKGKYARARASMQEREWECKCEVLISVAMVAADIFQINWFSVRNKIGKIVKIFVKIEDLLTGLSQSANWK
jgi:hypothetical protein